MLSRILFTSIIIYLLIPVTKGQQTYDFYSGEEIVYKDRGDKAVLKTGLFRNEIYLEYPNFTDTLKHGNRSEILRQTLFDKLEESLEFQSVYGDFKEKAKWYIGEVQIEENDWLAVEIKPADAILEDLTINLISVVDGNYYYMLSYGFKFYINRDEHDISVDRFLWSKKGETTLNPWKNDLTAKQNSDLLEIMKPDLELALNKLKLWGKKEVAEPEEEDDYEEEYEDEEYENYPDENPYYGLTDEQAQVYDFYNRREYQLEKWVDVSKASIIPLGWGCLVLFQSHSPASYTFEVNKLSYFIDFDKISEEELNGSALMAFKKLKREETSLENTQWLDLFKQYRPDSHTPIDPWIIAKKSNVYGLTQHNLYVSKTGDTTEGNTMEYRFEKENGITEIKGIQQNGRPWLQRSWEYNDQGKLVEERRLQSEDSTLYFYHYDDKGNLVEERCMNDYHGVKRSLLKFNGNKAYTLQTTLDYQWPEIKLVEQQGDVLFSSPTYFRFDKEGRISSFGANKYGSLYQINRNKYGDITEEYWDANRYSKLWHYNEDGVLQRYVYSDGNSSKTTYIFHYGKDPNLPEYISEVMTKGNNYKLYKMDWKRK